MDFPWGLVVVVGALHGGLVPPGPRRGDVLRSALVVGLSLGLVLGMLGILFDAGPFGLGNGLPGALLGVAMLVALYVAAAFVGSLVRASRRRHTQSTRPG